jgi:hypothetical protein
MKVYEVNLLQFSRQAMQFQIQIQIYNLFIFT